jgi:hypothetical protein
MFNFAVDSKMHRPGLKRNKTNILYAWLLLVCFIAGQYVVYSHQHKIIAGNTFKAQASTKDHSHTTVQEKCSICDAMHHTSAVIEQANYFSPNIVTKHFYAAYNYEFVSIALILAAGRAPPVTAFV